MANLNNILVNSSRKEIVTGRKMTSLIMTAAMIISLFAGMTLSANAATNSTTLQNGGPDTFDYTSSGTPLYIYVKS